MQTKSSVHQSSKHTPPSYPPHPFIHFSPRKSAVVLPFSLSHSRILRRTACFPVVVVARFQSNNSSQSFHQLNPVIANFSRKFPSIHSFIHLVSPVHPSPNVDRHIAAPTTRQRKEWQRNSSNEQRLFWHTRKQENVATGFGKIGAIIDRRC